MKLDLTGPFALTNSLLDQFEYDDCMDLRIDPIYTGNVVDANIFGCWGYLPVAGRSTGDLIALYPLIGRPISEWPVVELPHNGEGGTSCAANIHSFASVFAAQSGIHFSEDLDQEEKVFTELGVILGDKNVAQVFRALRAEGWLDESESTRQRLAEGDSVLTRFFSTYESVYSSESPDPVPVWENFLKLHPEFSCAWHLLLGGLMKSGDRQRRLEVAFTICVQDYMNDNYWAFPACRMHGHFCGVDASDEGLEYLFEEDVSKTAARIVFEEGRLRYESSPVWPAIQAMAEDSLLGDVWLSCAKKLESKGRHLEAYRAYHTANRHYSGEVEESNPETWQGGLRCARALGDTNVEQLLTALEESEDADEDSE